MRSALPTVTTPPLLAYSCNLPVEKATAAVSWLRHCLCPVFPLPSWLRHCLSLRSSGSSIDGEDDDTDDSGSDGKEDGYEVWCLSTARRGAANLRSISTSSTLTPQNGLYSNNMDLITSDCGTTRSLSIKLP